MFLKPTLAGEQKCINQKLFIFGELEESIERINCVIILMKEKPKDVNLSLVDEFYILFIYVKQNHTVMGNDSCQDMCNIIIKDKNSKCEERVLIVLVVGHKLK